MGGRGKREEGPTHVSRTSKTGIKESRWLKFRVFPELNSFFFTFYAKILFTPSYTNASAATVEYSVSFIQSLGHPWDRGKCPLKYT